MSWPKTVKFASHDSLFQESAILYFQIEERQCTVVCSYNSEMQNIRNALTTALFWFTEPLVNGFSCGVRQMLLVRISVMAIFIEVIKMETNICYYEPSDWWRKMSVDWRCQAIMQELVFREHSRTEVNRLHHASCCHNTKQRVKVGFIRDSSSIQRDRKGPGTVDLKMHTLTAEKKHGFVLWYTTRHLTKPFPCDSAGSVTH